MDIYETGQRTSSANDQSDLCCQCCQCRWTRFSTTWLESGARIVGEGFSGGTRGSQLVREVLRWYVHYVRSPSYWEGYANAF